MDKKVSVLPVSEEFLLLAKRIHKAAAALRRINARQSSPKDWARHMLALVEVDGCPKEEVLACFSWYAANLDGEYVPHAYGESLRARYGSILDAYRRAHGMSAPAPKEPLVEISEDAARLAKHALQMGWPAVTDRANFPAAVQKTLDFYRRVLATLQRLAQSPVAYKSLDPERVARWAEYLAGKLARPTNLTELWWDNYALPRALRLRNWDGKLRRLTPSPDHEEIRPMFFNGWLSGYALSAAMQEYWELFQQEIRK